ncbi:hypothetical protein VV01_09540 [Luteipulveratus halotolerans]|uniref:DUF2306 domain-containing protein n=1 Tax=Luteipulveratus halotolerans TaxID=1631356 RepID=A0A0L6CNI4_9MICO|nr:hypothetical protein VV01_09540 [Luteipulveratus halotolerans]
MWALVIGSVVYAPIAMTAIWPYASPGAPSLGPDVLERATDYSYVHDALIDRQPVYDKNIPALLVHTIGGGLLMLLGPAQLLSVVRRRRRLHRTVGVVYAVTVYVSMIGALIYLMTTPMAEVFSGPVFSIALTTILIGTVMSVTFGLVALAQGQIQMHFRWMALNYAFLMTAPVLRLEWGVLKQFHPEATLAEVNMMSVMNQGGLVVFAAAVASRMLDSRRPAPGIKGTWLPWPAFIGSAFFCLVALIPIGVVFHSWGASGDRLFAYFAVPYLAAAAVMIWCIVRSTRAGRTLASEEWRWQLFLLCGVPGLALALAFAFQNWLGQDSATALTAAVAVSWGVSAFGAFMMIGLRLYLGTRAAEKVSISRRQALSTETADPERESELVDAR